MAACFWSVRHGRMPQYEWGLFTGDWVRACISRVLPVKGGTLLPPTFLYEVPSIFQITVHSFKC